MLLSNLCEIFVCEIHVYKTFIFDITDQWQLPFFQYRPYQMHKKKPEITFSSTIDKKKSKFGSETTIFKIWKKEKKNWWTRHTYANKNNQRVDNENKRKIRRKKKRSKIVNMHINGWCGIRSHECEMRTVYIFIVMVLVDVDIAASAI